MTYYLFRNIIEDCVDQGLPKVVWYEYIGFVILPSQRIVHVLARFLVIFVEHFLVDKQRRHEADLMVPSMFSASLGLLSKRYNRNFIMHTYNFVLVNKKY